MAERNLGEPDHRRIDFRIGVNLGDVIIEGDDIHGDGVNIAARLEGLAEPSGICISAKVHEEVRNKLDVTFEELGAQELKNISAPVRAYRMTPDRVANAPGMAPLALPDKPSIAVLPFDNLSGDPEQEYFADGLSEDIITGLSKFHWFFVIARNSSFTYKGRSVDVKQVANELGVQYVLEGSVRKAGSRVRITAQLIDAPTGRHVWAERYDRDLEDIFAVQDEVTEAIVGAVAPTFVSAEARRIERKLPENFDAWDYAMRGNWYLSRRGKEDVAQALRLFETALELDPNSTLALSGLALTLGLAINFGWVDDFEEARAAGHAAARKAVNVDENDAGAYVGLALILFYMHRLDEAVAACRRAISLNPNLAMAEGWLAVILGWRGDYEEGAVHAENATRLSPLDTFSIGSFAHTGVEFGAGRYEQCVEWARKTIEVTPEFPAAWRYLAGSLALLDRTEEARAAKDQLLRLMPHESLRLVRAALPSVNRDRMERFVEGMRKAGVPE
jgi:adenylate cyclase